MGYDKNKVDEIVKLNNYRVKLIEKLKDLMNNLDNKNPKLILFESFIDSNNEQVQEKMESLFSSDDNEFDKDYDLTKFRIAALIHEIKLMIDNLTKSTNESTKLINILKEILKPYKPKKYATTRFT